MNVIPTIQKLPDIKFNQRKVSLLDNLTDIVKKLKLNPPRHVNGFKIANSYKNWLKNISRNPSISNNQNCRNNYSSIQNMKSKDKISYNATLYSYRINNSLKNKDFIDKNIIEKNNSEKKKNCKGTLNVNSFSINNTFNKFYQQKNIINKSLNTKSMSIYKDYSINKDILIYNAYNEDKEKHKEMIIDNYSKKKNNIFVRNLKNEKKFHNFNIKISVPKFINNPSRNIQLDSIKLIETNKETSIPLLKNLQNIENLNNVNNFIIILKQHIAIDKELNLLIDNSYEKTIEKGNMIRYLINQLNIFFELLNYVSFEIIIFIFKNYNSLLQKILKLLIVMNCFLLIYIVLYDINLSINMIKLHFLDIIGDISFCIYKFFEKFIQNELKLNHYNDLSFISVLDKLSSKYKYNIKQFVNNSEILMSIEKCCNMCVGKISKKFKNNSNFNNPIFKELTNLMSTINSKDLLYYINICENVFLYTLLSKNIQKAQINIKNNKNFCSLNRVPYLPPINQAHKYTIVLDMDETLGHFVYNEIDKNDFSKYGYLTFDDENNFDNIKDKNGKIKVGIFLIRPYAKYFLEELKNLSYEIVIFTAGTKDYCDKILSILDINDNLINYRLYRAHMSLKNINNDVKDLSLLGRDLKKVIIVDNLPENYKLQENNGLPINSWIGDIRDTSLKDILTVFQYIVKNNINDVRDVVKNVKNKFSHNSSGNVEYKGLTF